MDDNQLDREESQNLNQAPSSGPLRDDDNLANNSSPLSDQDETANRFHNDFRETIGSTDQFDDESLQREAENDYPEPSDQDSDTQIPNP